MRATYFCKQCNKEFLKTFSGPATFLAECPDCKASCKKQFKPVSTKKEDENVSKAIQEMLYAGLPSGKDKSVF